MVLNMSVSNQYEAVPASTNPELVVREIMTKLVFLMKGTMTDSKTKDIHSFVIFNLSSIKDQNTVQKKKTDRNNK